MFCGSTTMHTKPLLHFMATLGAYMLLTTACRSTTTKNKGIVAFTWPQWLRERARCTQCTVCYNVHCLSCLLLISNIFN